MKIGLALSLALLLGGHANAEGVRFTEKPGAARVKGGQRITFAVSAPTDVEVSVLDADGRIVCHLAAGVLGAKTPPPPPLKPGLKQTLLWDGKTDTGVAAAGGPFSVRVRLGMRAELDGFLAERRESIGALRGLATDAGGNLYVYAGSMQVFDREGKYVKTLMPMPADLAKKRLLPFNSSSIPYWLKGKPLNVPGKYFQPRNYRGTAPWFYPGRTSVLSFLAPRLTADGRLLLYYSDDLARLHTDGGATPDEPFWQRIWKGRKRTNNYRVTFGFMAVPSPDGKFVYLSGLADPKSGFPSGRIYLAKAAPGSRMEPFADVAGKAPPPPFYRADVLAGADCDKDGDLLVCDWGNDRVRVFGPDGKETGGFAVAGPEVVACHRKTGHVYVVSTRPAARKGWVKRMLVKLDSWKKDAKKLAEIALPEMVFMYGTVGSGAKTIFGIHMALDESADPAVVWIGQSVSCRTVRGRSRRKECYLWRLEDRKNGFVKTEDLLDRSRDHFGIMTRLAVHPETDQVVFSDLSGFAESVNGLTGEPMTLPFETAIDMGVGLDGHWYVHPGGIYDGPICRFDKSFTPLPVPGKKGNKRYPSNTVGKVYARWGAGYCAPGVAADQTGRVYSLQMYTWAKYAVAAFGRDGVPADPGRMKDDAAMQKCTRFRSALIGPIGDRLGGIQVDWQGNVYVGKKLLPVGHRPPAGFETIYTGYFGLTGSIIKFAPSGGAILDAKDGAGRKGLPAGLRWERGSSKVKNVFLEGALKLYPGLGSIGGSFGGGCMCRQPSFQLDGWGRLFYPNAITSSVRIVDNAGNLIQQFGHYGNIDSRGPGEDSAIKTPPVPLGWPQAVGVSGTKVYVLDVLNSRIVRMNKVYAAEATCAIK